MLIDRLMSARKGATGAARTNAITSAASAARVPIPLPLAVTVGAPSKPISSTPVTGVWTCTLPAGASFHNAPA